MSPTREPSVTANEAAERHVFEPRGYATVPWNMVCRHCDGSKDDEQHADAVAGLTGEEPSDG